MKSFYWFIAYIFLFCSCNKENKVLKDSEVKLIIRSALSNKKFYSLLQSTTIDSFNLRVNSTIKDSIHIKKIVVFINFNKNRLSSEKVILAHLDSVASRKRILKLICGNFEPPSSKIYGEFKITFSNNRWIVTPLDIGINDYR